MIAALSIFMVRLITFFFGKPAAHFFPRPPIQDQEIETYFFRKGSNFQATMARLLGVQVAMFGPSGLATFVKLNLLHYLFFVSALLIFLLMIPGFDEVFSFVRRGFTLDLDANERSYLLQHFNDTEPPGGLYVGDAVSRMSIMTLIFMATISASGSVALIYNFLMIKTFAGRNLGLIATNARLAVAFLISVASDLGAVVILLVAVVLLGKVAGPRIEEVFEASLPEHTFEYGVSPAIGDAARGETYWVYGLRAMDVDSRDFGELTTKVEKPRWPQMIFASRPLYIGDAGKICDQYAIDRDDCGDRMRAMLLRHIDVRAEWILHVARAMSAYVGSLACGRNLWSGISAGPGASQALRLGLSFFASLAALLLARAFLIPWLIILSFVDRAVVALGRRASLQSVEGHGEISVHGAALLSLPPVIAAIALLSLFVRIFC
jgi:hypothetical protein